MLMGAGFTDHDYVFAMPDGQCRTPAVINPGNLTGRWREAGYRGAGFMISGTRTPATCSPRE